MLDCTDFVSSKDHETIQWPSWVEHISRLVSHGLWINQNFGITLSNNLVNKKTNIQIWVFHSTVWYQPWLSISDGSYRYRGRSFSSAVQLQPGGTCRGRFTKWTEWSSSLQFPNPRPVHWTRSSTRSKRRNFSVINLCSSSVVGQRLMTFVFFTYSMPPI